MNTEWIYLGLIALMLVLCCYPMMRMMMSGLGEEKQPEDRQQATKQRATKQQATETHTDGAAAGAPEAADR